MFLQQPIADAVLDSMNMNTIPIQFTFSTLIVWTIDYLKRTDMFPWLSDQTTNLNRAAAVIGAALTSAGIHFGLETSSTAVGTYSFVITGLTTVAIAHFLSGFMLSLVGQHSILKAYQGVNLLREIAEKLKLQSEQMVRAKNEIKDEIKESK